MKQFYRSLCTPLAALTFVTAGPLPMAQAAMVPTQQVLAPADVAPDRDRVGGFLARDDVRNQMMRLGVSPEEAAQRVAALSDAEISRLNGTLMNQPAGGDVVGILIIILIVLGIVFLVQRV
jgi:hypothetical protein